MENPPVLSKVVAYIVFGFIFTGFCLLLSYIITLEVTDIADIPKGDYLWQRFVTMLFLDPSYLTTYAIKI